ncbi:hypothetical protein [Bartonella vinsonii]|uniref:hypothetical protein n=1 Tax=Bartonella vinsonii TaxID=33047 RepID=UPI001ABB7249|nr:hypothetical protein [Bartonella vinsonii]
MLNKQSFYGTSIFQNIFSHKAIITASFLRLDLLLLGGKATIAGIEERWKIMRQIGKKCTKQGGSIKFISKL